VHSKHRRELVKDFVKNFGHQWWSTNPNFLNAFSLGCLGVMHHLFENVLLIPSFFSVITKSNSQLESIRFTVNHANSLKTFYEWQAHRIGSIFE